MYLMEGLQQIPVRDRAFAGTLGDPGSKVILDKLDKLLDKVRARPQDHKRLLLTVTVHPEPTESHGTQTFPGHPGSRSIVEFLINTGISADDFLKELRLIRDAFRDTNKNFSEQIDAEVRLRDEVIKTFGKVGINSEKMKPFLLAPLFALSDVGRLPAGLEFAKKMLSTSLIQRIRSSTVADAHFVRLGRLLSQYGEVLQRTDAGFKRVVEQERIRRQQVQQEQEKKAKQAEEKRKRIEQQRRRGRK
jgi:hypothetical protein